MGPFSFWEILLIFVAILLLFGAKRIPEIAGSMGKGIREFKRSLTDTSDAIMGDDRQRTNLPPRQMDAPPTSPPQGGEPKRLSQ